MPCYQSTNVPVNLSTAGSTSYATEAECLQACKEGACCEGTTCSVKPQCQCQGTGKVFKGVGTTCEPETCLCKCSSENNAVPPAHLYATITGGSPWDGTYVLDRLSNSPGVTSNCYTQAGFNWSFFSADGSIYRGRTGTCCNTYYCFLYDADCNAAPGAWAFTSPVTLPSVRGLIMITSGLSYVALPYKSFSHSGSQCCYSPVWQNGPSLRNSGSHCAAGWSVADLFPPEGVSLGPGSPPVCSSGANVVSNVRVAYHA